MINRIIIAKELNEVANKFEECGLDKEAEQITEVMKKVAQYPMTEEELAQALEELNAPWNAKKEQERAELPEFSDEDMATFDFIENLTGGDEDEDLLM